MTIVLRNQVEASEISAEELLAAVRNDRVDRVTVEDVQDLLANLVLQLQDLHRQVRWWQDGPEPDAMPELLLEQLYRSLAITFEKAGTLCQRLEDSGVTVRGKLEFQKSWRELRNITCFSVESIRTAASQFEKGETHTLGEAMNELWDHPVV